MGDSLPLTPGGLTILVIEMSTISLRNTGKFGGAKDWKGDNEVHLLAGIRGPGGLIVAREVGKARITNGTKDLTYTYKTVKTDGLGFWDGDPRKVVVAPGRTTKHTAAWDAKHNLVIMDFKTREYIPTEDDKKSDGKVITFFDDVMEWVSDNYVVVIAAVVTVAALWLFLLPALSKRIGG